MLGPWKRKCLSEFGIVTQCIAPTRVNDQYLTNVLLKINAKVDLSVFFTLFVHLVLMLFVFAYWWILLWQLGGMNSLLHIEDSPTIPFVSKTPTIILGMDVSHGSPGRSDVPSIAAVWCMHPELCSLSFFFWGFRVIDILLNVAILFALLFVLPVWVGFFKCLVLVFSSSGSCSNCKLFLLFFLGCKFATVATHF